MRRLRFVGLEEKAPELAGTLSYGQQKLLTTACCVATETQVLLLDDPVAGVHPEMADRIVSLLGELEDAGKLVVFIEHDLGAVRRAADSVVVMNHGRVIAQGTPDDVLNRAEIMNAYLCAASTEILPWIQAHSEADPLLVIADDFAGTGGTLVKGIRRLWQHDKKVFSS